jgi:hypothetical protein
LNALLFSSCSSVGWILIVEVACLITSLVRPVGSLTIPSPCIVQTWPLSSPHHLLVPPSYSRV